MAFQQFFGSETEIPEELRSLYTEGEHEGQKGFVLNAAVAGMQKALKASREEADRYRSAVPPGAGNQLEDFKKAFEDYQRNVEAKLIKAGDVDELRKRIASETKAPLEEQITRLTEQIEKLKKQSATFQAKAETAAAELQKRHHGDIVTDQLKPLLAKVKPQYHGILEQMFRDEFDYTQEGVPLRETAPSDWVSDGVTPTPETWLNDSFAPRFTDLMVGNSGGGARNEPAPNGVATQNNPFMQGPAFNLTEQIKLRQDKPELAARMEAAAAAQLNTTPN